MNTVPEIFLLFSTFWRTVWFLWFIPLGLTLFLVVFFRLRRGSSSATMRAIARLIQTQGIPPYRAARSNYSRELTRARRYRHPLTIVVIKMEYISESVCTVAGRNGAPAGEKPQLSHYVIPLTGGILQGTLRESDIVSYDIANDRFVLLLAETTKSQALLAMERLLKLISTRILVTFMVGLAEFPDDGLTIESLVQESQEASKLWHITKSDAHDTLTNIER